MDQHEDIYETDDLPESEQDAALQKEKFDSEHIESIQLNVGAAFQRFKGKALNTDDSDFSDSISFKRRKGYGGGQYVLELMPSEGGEPETPVERYNRLLFELSQLSEQVASLKESAAKDEKNRNVAAGVTVEEVSSLQQQLKQLQVEQILGKPATLNANDPQGAIAEKITRSLDHLQAQKPTKKGAKETAADGPVVYECFVRPDVAQSTGMFKVGELESRLAKLESLVGDTEKLAALTGDSRGGRGLADAVEILQGKVQMLDLAHVDALDARMSALLQKMKRYGERNLATSVYLRITQLNEKKEQMDAEDAGRVNELFEMMKKWDGFCASLPDLVTRMQALQELHEQALQFSQSLTQLSGVQQQLLKTVEQDGALLGEVRSTLSENMNQIKSNCESLEARLKGLGK